MEASGSTPTPPPEGEPQAPPPADPATPAETPAASSVETSDDGRAGGGWRVLGAILAIVLAFACAVMVIAMLDIGDSPVCTDVANDPQLLKEFVQGDEECFGELSVSVPSQKVVKVEGSSAKKTASLILGWPSAVLAGIAALVALLFTFTGRRGGLLLRLTAAAVLLGALSILIGSI